MRSPRSRSLPQRTTSPTSADVGGADLLTPAAAAGSERIWIVCDADPPSRRGDRPGTRSAHELADQLVAAGKAVRVAPARGAEGEDYADILAAHIRSGDGDPRRWTRRAEFRAAWCTIARVCAVCGEPASDDLACPACGAPAGLIEQALLGAEAP